MKGTFAAIAGFGFCGHQESEWKVIYKEVDGYRIKTNQEWAEVCFVPDKRGYSKKSPVYRYLAIREVMGSMTLGGMAEIQQPLP